MGARVARWPDVDLVKLWAGCRPVTAAPAIAAWLQDRKVEPSRVVERDLARVLPAPSTWAPWAHRLGAACPPVRSWLLLPLYSAYGSVAALYLHAIDRPEGSRRIGRGGNGLYGKVLADRTARRLLAGSPMPMDGRTVVVAQGVSDFLDWATSQPDTDDGPAVFGVVEDGWTDAVAARIPDHLRVLVRSHDGVVDRNAQRVVTTLGMRCQVIVRRS